VVVDVDVDVDVVVDGDVDGDGDGDGFSASDNPQHHELAAVCAVRRCSLGGGS
jgi:hypothetical protein